METEISLTESQLESNEAKPLTVVLEHLADQLYTNLSRYEKTEDKEEQEEMFAYVLRGFEERIFHAFKDEEKGREFVAKEYQMIKRYGGRDINKLTRPLWRKLADEFKSGKEREEQERIRLELAKYDDYEPKSPQEKMHEKLMNEISSDTKHTKYNINSTYYEKLLEQLNQDQVQKIVLQNPQAHTNYYEANLDGFDYGDDEYINPFQYHNTEKHISETVERLGGFDPTIQSILVAHGRNERFAS